LEIISAQYFEIMTQNIESKNFGERIQNRLELLGLSYEQAGRSVGKYHQWVSSLIECDTTSTSAEAVEKLCRILSVKDGQLVREEVVSEDSKQTITKNGVRIPDYEDINSKEYLSYMLSYFKAGSMVDKYVSSMVFNDIENIVISLCETDKVLIFMPSLPNSQKVRLAKLISKAISDRGVRFIIFVPEYDLSYLHLLDEVEDDSKLIVCSTNMPIMHANFITEAATGAVRSIVAVEGWYAQLMNDVRFVQMDEFATQRNSQALFRISEYAEYISSSATQEGVEPSSKISVKILHS